jgi:antitoxin MazE
MEKAEQGPCSGRGQRLAPLTASVRQLAALRNSPHRGYIVVTMKTKIVRVGNSRGVRIPKLLLEQTGLGDEVVIEAEGNCLVIRPLSRPREGWDEAFRAMAKAGDDKLLDGDLASTSKWDEEEWEW